MMVQSSVVRRARYLEIGGMWPKLALRHDTHLFFKLGLGQSICAVAGIGVTMTDDAADDRLTRNVTPLSRAYWEETVNMYSDLRRASRSHNVARTVFDDRLATAHWRLVRLAIAERRPAAAGAPLAALVPIEPLFIPGGPRALPGGVGRGT